MANQKTQFYCTNCGEVVDKWQGQCPACKEWDTFREEIIQLASRKNMVKDIIMSGETNILNDISISDDDRILTGLLELNRVFGGGIVRGSVTLIGGEPGAGKSTLLLQVCGSIENKLRVIYFSGEESLKQIKLRADRLSVSGDNIEIANETDIESIVSIITKKRPDLVVIDSIQTMNYASLPSSPGSVAQVRECSAILLNTAKETGTAVLMIGHVNKEGSIAGPKVMEHIVDTVLYFEGDRLLSHRVLRSSKNRFGSTNEIALFEMTERGLESIVNPSAALLEGRESSVSGSCVTCIMEGTRPILTEVQSLAVKTSFAAPRRTTAGYDYNRLNLILAVLERRAGYYISNLDVYVNIAGGLEIDEPAGDLAIACSIVSSILNRPIPYDCIVFGEVGLGGEVRPVKNPEARLSEAYNLGFTKFLLPYGNLSRIESMNKIVLLPIRNVSEIARKLEID